MTVVRVVSQTIRCPFSHKSKQSTMSKDSSSKFDMTPLGESYTPTSFDVICARGENGSVVEVLQKEETPAHIYIIDVLDH